LIRAGLVIFAYSAHSSFYGQQLFSLTNNVFTGLCIAFIIFCQITVYREVRRHEKQLSTLQVTEEARQKILKDKKNFKLTAIIASLLL